jgi:L-cysteine S-thiosulfotransferase
LSLASVRRCALPVVLASLAACTAPTPAAPDARRAGADFMSPALQALQRDDTRNPGMLWVQEGQALWSQRAANGRSCAGCHADGLQGVAARHPAFDATLGEPRTLASRIDQCRVQHLGESLQAADGAQVLPLSAWLAHRSRGEPVAPPRGERMKPWNDRGAQLWQQRLGQLNLSCAQCHDQRAGARLGGAPIPQAHPTGYPSYRLEWQGLGTLERRLRTCVVGVRAEPFAAGADEWLALEVYLMQRAAGMPYEGVAVRP